MRRSGDVRSACVRAANGSLGVGALLIVAEAALLGGPADLHHDADPLAADAVPPGAC